jgi:outer membrane protein OmpA-like peptidoglycan-associated protein
MWTANAKYFINNDFSVVASYADLEPYQRGNKEDFYRYRPIVGSIRYNIFHHLPVSPYLTIGAGYSTNSHTIPGAQTVKWDGLALQGGVGFEFFITEGASLGAEALYHNFAADGNNTPYRLASLVGMMNIYFGPGPSARRTEAALEKEKAAAAEAQAAAQAAQQQAQAQAAASAAQQQASAQSQATQSQQAQAAQAEAARREQELQAQVTQAQAEMDQIKQMVARKDIAPVNFKSGSADLLVESHATLDKVAESAKKYPSLKLRVEGHTDTTGNSDANQALSQKRADAVRDYLVSSAGVPADQITAVGFGQTHPIDSNATASGRAKNRRVEFIFFLK